MPKGVYTRTPINCPKPCPVGCVCSKHDGLSNSLRQRGTDQRTGVAAKGFFFNKRGYKVLTGQQGHPLATNNHQIGEHRLVLFKKIGDGPHLCHWQCGKTLEWGAPKATKIFADHIDGDVTNNHPQNLVPSCWLCNFRRGRAGDPVDWKSDYVPHH